VLVLPARNEAPRLAAVLARVPAEVAGRPVAIIVVDDGSTDGTADVALGGGAKVVAHEQNVGLGAAVRTGFRAALTLGPAVVAFCDADGEYAPEELHWLVAPILAGAADCVVGSRFRGDIRRMLAHRRFGNRVLTMALAWIARRPITDVQSGYRALSAWAASAAEIVHDYNYAQVLTLDLLGKSARYSEVPISYAFRDSGRSFVRLGRYLHRVGPAVYRQLNPEESPVSSAR
jgi:glycosyltransferase involved in cell wall biosynthesis